jgi:hypothetical protein
MVGVWLFTVGASLLLGPISKAERGKRWGSVFFPSVIGAQLRLFGCGLWLYFARPVSQLDVWA